MKGPQHHAAGNTGFNKSSPSSRDAAQVSADTNRTIICSRFKIIELESSSQPMTCPLMSDFFLTKFKGNFLEATGIKSAEPGPDFVYTTASCNMSVAN